MTKSILPGSKGLDIKGQKALLDPRDKMPHPSELVYFLILHYLITGERLMFNRYSTTDARGSGGSLVKVGCFKEGGLGLYDWKGGRDMKVGISAYRKFE
jgi:hypothetical protein